jgi:ketosteroid isomerase-like protein
MPEQDDRQAVTNAADRLIAAFSKNDTKTYFTAFSEQATFLFHNLDRVLMNRAEYQAEWQSWEDQHQFRILSCESSERHLQMFGEVAVFTHQVLTDINFDSETVTNHERETIVFARDDSGVWLGVHEHLSVFGV